MVLRQSIVWVFEVLDLGQELTLSVELERFPPLRGRTARRDVLELPRIQELVDAGQEILARLPVELLLHTDVLRGCWDVTFQVEELRGYVRSRGIGRGGRVFRTGCGFRHDRLLVEK